MKSSFVVVLMLLPLFISTSLAGESLNNQIQYFESIIGVYPPNINSKEEIDAVKKKYIATKKELDLLIEKKPNDEKLLFMRGHLQSMGHNIDYPGAWQGATDDLKALLNVNPSHIPAIIELATLWVNSDPKLAPRAEQLFRGAQCYNKEIPLEAAQRGVFFALYYQGKMIEAYRQSEYLVKAWPENTSYRKLKEMTGSVLARSKQEVEVKDTSPEKLVMATCRE